MRAGCRHVGAFLLAVMVLGACSLFDDEPTSSPVGEGGRLEVEIFDVSPRLANNRSSDEIPSGRGISLAVAEDGRRAYAGTVHGGFWRSDDGGLSWYQPWLPQPGDGDRACPDGAPDPCRLGSRTIATIAVSPVDPDLVFVGTANDRGRPERDGIYRSRDGGLTWQLVHQQQCLADQGVPDTRWQPIGQIVFAPDDPTKLFAAVGCGLAYSTVTGDDPAQAGSRESSSAVGQTWTVTTSTEFDLGIFHVGVAEATTAGRAVWACGRRWTLRSNGPSSNAALWYSADGGRSFARDTGPLSSQIRCDPPDGVHGGLTNTDAFAVDPRSGTAYFVTYANPSVTGFRLDCDGARENTRCPITGGERRLQEVATSCGTAGLTCDMGVLQADFEPNRGVFLLAQHSRPPQLADVPAGSGEVTLTGHLSPDRSTFQLYMSDTATMHVANAPPASPDGWHRLDGPGVAEVCNDVSATDSRFQCLDLLPRRGETKIHVDPHAFAMPSTLDLVIGAGDDSGIHRRLGRCPSEEALAPLLMSNDGGIIRTVDCGATWTQAEGFNTVVGGELAGLSQRGHLAALYFGGRDNNSWWSGDGGAVWQTAVNCGDCSGFFTDDPTPLVAHTVRVFPDRATHTPPNVWQLQARTWTAERGYPDPVSDTPVDTMFSRLPYVDGTVFWQPLIKTLPSERPALRGDLVIVAGTSPTQVDDISAGPPYFVQRNNNGRGWRQVGPSIPATSYPVVQAVGGHATPTYYVGNRVDVNYGAWNAERQPLERMTNGSRLWKSRLDRDGQVTGWDCIVPGPDSTGTAADGCAPNPLVNGACPPNRACRAWAFVASPYDPRVIYIVDDDGVKLSVDGGSTWRTQPELTRWLTDNGRITPPCRWTCGFSDADQLLTDLVFVANEPTTRFATGNNGVFFTVSAATPGDGNRDERWHRLLDPLSLACQPTKVFFDSRGLSGRSLYVGCVQRGVLRLDRIPTPDQATEVDARRVRISVNLASFRPDVDEPPPQIRFDAEEAEEQEEEEVTKEGAVRLELPAPPLLSLAEPIAGAVVQVAPPPVPTSVPLPPPGGDTGDTTGTTGTPGTTATTQPPAEVRLSVQPPLVELDCAGADPLPPFEVVLDAGGSEVDVPWSAIPFETVPDGSEPWAGVKPAEGTVPVGQKMTVSVTPAASLCAQLAKQGKADLHVRFVWPGGEAVVTVVVVSE
ncbi:MAG: WD40/YVTN/BNR-like repeat-containing protein [Acidimicrobiales bacterium]